MRSAKTSLLRHHCLLTAFIYFALLAPVSLGDDEEGPIVTIEPFRLSMEAGDDADITCSVEGYEVESIRWLDPSGKDIEQLVNTSIQYNNATTASMDIVSARVEDSGTYTCVVTLRDVMTTQSDVAESLQINQTFWLNIYIMPTYLREGMIVLGLNLGLGLVFGALVVHTLIVDRRRAAKYGRISE